MTEQEPEQVEDPSPDAPEPGEVGDLELGVPGDPEPLPANDRLQDEPCAVNDDEDDDDEEEAESWDE